MKKQAFLWLLTVISILILTIYSVYTYHNDNKKIFFTGKGQKWEAQLVMTIKEDEVSEFLEIIYLGSNPEDIGEVFFSYQMPGNSVSGRRHLDRATKSITSYTSSQGGFMPSNFEDHINLRIEWKGKEENFELQRK